MPIPDRFGALPHLDDEAFAEVWAASHSGDDGGHPHLAQCAECRDRFGAFGDWLSDLRETAWAEADEVFPTAQLAAQRAAIDARLDALATPGRVIAFPGQAQPTMLRHHRSRWIAAAAAAGLILGLGAGQMLNLTRPASAPVTTARAATPVATQAARDVGAMDETIFYSDAAVTTPRVEALQALDALTPRIRDIDLPR